MKTVDDMSVNVVESIDDVRPDRVFLRRLKEIDQKLDCVFNGKHFVITYQTDKFGRVNIWRVVSDDGGFRQPDNRDLDLIRESDIERTDVNERFNLAVAYMERFAEKRRQQVRDELRDRTKDNRIQLARALNPLAGAGKGNSAFRRITPTPKGRIIIP